MIGPKRLLPRLEDRADREGDWLVTPAIDGEAFTVIDAAMQRSTLRKMRADLEAGRIGSAWFLSKHIAAHYRNLLRGFDYLLRTVPTPLVVNISLGPPMKHAPLDPEDPVHTIFRSATVKGLFVVTAQGNEGRADGTRDGIINPWAAPEWAIGVGACNDDGSEVMGYSSRGDPGRPETWPDLVAPGTSALDPAQQGTSFAAPRVAAAVAQIIHFLSGFARAAVPGSALKLRVPQQTLAACSAFGPRLAGHRLPWDEDGMPVFEFAPAPTPKLVRQVLRDFTRPVPGAPPHVAGAGVLDSARLYDELGGFGRPEPEILSIKVI